MTEKQTQAMQSALDAYRLEAEADPGGARRRLLKTGIWTPGGKLTSDYGQDPGKAHRPA